MALEEMEFTPGSPADGNAPNASHADGGPEAIDVQLLAEKVYRLILKELRLDKQRGNRAN